MRPIDRRLQPVSSTPPGSPPVRRVLDESIRFVMAMVDGGAELDGDVFQLTATTWAIHARIAVDGETILAEYDTPEDAQHVIDSVRISIDSRLNSHPARRTELT